MLKAGDKVVLLLPKAEPAQSTRFHLAAGVFSARFNHEDLAEGKIPLGNSSVRSHPHAAMAHSAG